MKRHLVHIIFASITLLSILSVLIFHQKDIGKVIPNEMDISFVKGEDTDLDEYTQIANLLLDFFQEDGEVYHNVFFDEFKTSKIAIRLRDCNHSLNFFIESAEPYEDSLTGEIVSSYVNFTLNNGDIYLIELNTGVEFDFNIDNILSGNINDLEDFSDLTGYLDVFVYAGGD